MAEATVLVVDDDAGFRAYVRATLERGRFRVVEAASGADAVTVALRERPDAILLDWRMPGHSGIAACRDLRAEPTLAGVRIAVITGLDDERDRTLARHAGADAFFIKDPDPDALTGQVRRLLAVDGVGRALAGRRAALGLCSRAMPEPTVPDHQRLAAMRRSYERGGLTEADLAPTWGAMLERWLDDAVAGGVREPNAMVVATADASGRPSLRTVLLKGLDADGLTFFTNYDSDKGHELATNPVASILFPWIDLQRQVRLTGAVRRLDPAASDAYFASRPYGSQIGAVASPQSRVVADRAALEAARDALQARYPEDVPRPESWGGYVVMPDAVEFWQGRPDRLHDRLRYRQVDGVWITERLAP